MDRLRNVVLLAVVSLALLSCSRERRVIPVKVFSKIYAEMFVTDQWLREQKTLRKTADTAMVYEPIFRKWGYTVEDYRRSVDHYTKDPEAFAEVFEGARAMLQARLDSLTAEKKAVERADSLRKVYEGWNLPSPKLAEELFGENHRTDTVSFETDSTFDYPSMVPVYVPVDSLLVQCGP